MSMTMTAARTRTVTWDDPQIAVEASREMTGIEYLRAFAADELPPPPMARLLGLEVDSVEEGRVVFSVVPAEYHFNPLGIVHGGLAATLFDSAMGCAVLSTLSAGAGFSTVDLHVTFVRAITGETGRVRCEAEVVHNGKTIATAQARLIDAAGRLHGHATGTFMILRR